MLVKIQLRNLKPDPQAEPEEIGPRNHILNKNRRSRGSAASLPEYN